MFCEIKILNHNFLYCQPKDCICFKRTWTGSSKLFFATIHKSNVKIKDSMTMIWIILSKRFERNLTTSRALHERKISKPFLGLTSSEIFLAKDTGLKTTAMQIANWSEILPNHSCKVVSYISRALLLNDPNSTLFFPLKIKKAVINKLLALDIHSRGVNGRLLF